MTVNSGKIADLRIYGDFLALEAIAPLENALVGCPLRKDALLQALSTVPVQQYIGSITNEELALTILNEYE